MLNTHLRTLRIEKLIYGGDALAREERQVFLVPKAAPGDLVEVAVQKAKSNLTETRLERVIEAGPNRIEAFCPHFAKCGGCDYQHIAYAAQSQYKREILRELFDRARIALPVEIELIEAHPFGYRNRTQFHFDKTEVGFLEKGTHKLVPIEQCPVSSPKINEALKALKRMSKNQRFPNFLRSLEIFTNEQDVQINVLVTNSPLAKHFFQWISNEIPGVQEGAIPYAAYGYEWKVSYRSFFQVNRFLIDALAETTVQGLAGKHAVDLFAGVGLFSLPLAKHFERVTAVESGKVAMYDLEANSQKYAVGNVRIVQADVEAYLQDLTEAPDVILADPPRSGLGQISAARLLEIKAPELRIVSCDPSTLLRDLAILTAGGYKIEKVVLVDLFPQTFHMETVTTLRLG